MDHDTRPYSEKTSLNASCDAKNWTDEIDLIDLVRILVRQRNIIFGMILFFSLGAVGFAFLSPKVYLAEAILLPPLAKDIEPLKISNVYATTVEQVYTEMIQNLESTAFRKQFFKENKLLDYFVAIEGQNISEELIFREKFSEVLQVHPKGKKGDFIIVKLQGNDPEQVANCLNNFISMVNTKTKHELIELVEDKVNSLKTSIQYEITGLRLLGERKLLDRIAIFEEALWVAKELGIVHRDDAGALPESLRNEPGFGVVVNTAGNPLYLRGTRELQAEIDMLKKRKNYDPFITNLRDREVKLAELDQINIDATKVNVVRIDKAAFAPQGPIKPKRMLIVALGIMVGLITGICMAFVMNFIQSYRPEVSG